jgi:rfaE bifunctional protein nucleotidyltransferase chain/domain
VNFRNKLIEASQLTAWRKQIKQSGQKLVVTNGCFDILHLGHVTYLEKARNFGDCLLVGVNSDAAVGKLKGPGRPVNSETDRALVLAALGSVDGVSIFTAATATDFLSAAQPDIRMSAARWRGRAGRSSWCHSCPVNPRPDFWRRYPGCENPGHFPGGHR